MFDFWNMFNAVRLFKASRGLADDGPPAEKAQAELARLRQSWWFWWHLAVLRVYLWTTYYRLQAVARYRQLKARTGRKK